MTTTEKDPTKDKTAAELLKPYETPLANIHQRILAVMADLDYIQKEAAKNDRLPYSFASHDAVTRAIHPLLVKHGIAMIPTVTSWNQEGNRTSVNMTVSFVNADDQQDKFEVNGFGYGIDKQDKGPGIAISYTTKYIVLKTFVLETGDDPERQNDDFVAPIPSEVQSLISAARLGIEKEDWLSCCLMDIAGGDHWLAAWGELGSKERASFKEIKKKAKEYATAMNSCASRDDSSGFGQLDDELSIEQARYLRDYGDLSDTSKAMLQERRTT